jgi:hypothetical protein
MDVLVSYQTGFAWVRYALRAREKALAFLLTATMVLLSLAAHAAPAPANSVIGNQASATYVDSTGTLRPAHRTPCRQLYYR